MATTQTITQRIALTGGADIKKELASLGAEGEAVFAKLQAAADKIKLGDKVNVQIKAIQSQLNGLATSLNKTGEQFKKVGSALSIGITAPLAAIAAASVKTASDFDTSLNDIQASFKGLSDTDLTSLGRQLRDLSTTSPKPLADMAGALSDIGRSGIPANQAMSVLRATVKLATPDQQNLAAATNLVISAINAFGLKAGDADAIAQKLFKAADDGRFKIDDLSASFGQITKTVSGSGVSLDDYLSALSGLTQSGQTVEQSQASLAAILQHVLSPSKALQSIFTSLSVKDFPTLVKRTGSFSSALGEIVSRARGSQSVLSDIFGGSGRGGALGAALLLTGNQAKQVADTLADLTSGTDRLSEAFDKAANTPAAKFTEAMNSLKSAGIDIGNDLLPALVSVAQAVAKVADAFTNLPKPVQDAIVGFGVFLAALGPIAFSIGSLLTTAGTLVSFFSKVLVPFIVSTLLPALEGIGGAFIAINPEIVAVIAIVALFAAAAAIVVTNWSTVSANLQGVWQNISNTFQAGVVSVENFAKSILSAFAGIGEQIAGFFTSGIQAIESAFSGLFNWVSGIISGLVSKLASLLSQITGATSSGTTNGKAGGGLIVGPGGPTSDSVPILASNGEFMIRAAAVKFYGRNLFSLLNSMQKPRGFALGGLVTRALGSSIPRAASAASLPTLAHASPGRPISLVLDGRTIGGLTAQPSAVSEIFNYARSRHARQAGRKPAWVGT